VLVLQGGVPGRLSLVVAIACLCATAAGCGRSTKQTQAGETANVGATTTTIDPCVLRRSNYESKYEHLDRQRVVLEDRDKQLLVKLSAAVANNSPDAGQLQAQHDAVVRELGDTQQRILQLETTNVPCTPCTTTSTMDQAGLCYEDELPEAVTPTRPSTSTTTPCSMSAMSALENGQTISGCSSDTP
jgi:hypothetical protein